MAASLVPNETPPSEPLEGVERMNVFSFFDISLILVLSPKIDPPVSCEEGSIASIPNRYPSLTKKLPKDSIKVDFPTPGGPENPTRTECPGLRINFEINS